MECAASYPPSRHVPQRPELQTRQDPASREGRHREAVDGLASKAPPCRCGARQPFPRRPSTETRAAGLLARGSSYWLPLPRDHVPSVFTQRSSPLTVAGPRRIRTGFPHPPERRLSRRGHTPTVRSLRRLIQVVKSILAEPEHRSATHPCGHGPANEGRKLAWRARVSRQWTASSLAFGPRSGKRCARTVPPSLPFVGTVAANRCDGDEVGNAWYHSGVLIGRPLLTRRSP